MKRFTVLLVILGLAAIVTSCSGGAKSCAAYTKHDTGTRPAYSEVQ